MKTTHKKHNSTNTKAKENGISKLSPEWQRVAYYFELLDQHGPADDLWKMLKLALIADNDHINQHDRSNMLFFYEYTKELFTDIYTLLQHQTKKQL